MIGAETELDRQVLELIKDPLTHMVRNSADHGLETPERAPRRRQAGDRPHHAERLSRRRAHHHRDRRRRPRPRRSTRIQAKIAGATASRPRPSSAQMSEQQIQQFIFTRRLLDRRSRSPPSPAAASAWTWSRPTSRRSAAPIELALARGPGHHLHHQDPADAGHRLGADRRVRAASASPSRRSAWSSWCASAAASRARSDRADQGRAGAAPARPAAAAGRAAPSCCGLAAPASDGTRRFIVVTPGRRAGLRHHRRPRVRHRGNRGQAGGADPAPHHACSPATPSWATAASS